MQKAPKVLFHEHTETREAEFILLCLSSVIYTFVVVVKSDSVTDCIIYEAMSKRPETVE